MLPRIALTCLVFFAITSILQSCSQSADSPAKASEFLTASPKWIIDEISVNDAVTFKDGKMTKQFGGIDFERYMETVEVRKDGIFSGNFKGEQKPFVMQWRATAKDILVGLGGSQSRGSDWTIAPQDVTKESFVMKTKSTAYDFPRVTSIALKFKAGK